MTAVVVNDQGFREIIQGEPFQYGDLDLKHEELRFLVLQRRPAGTGHEGLDGLVSCTIETQLLAHADPFIAVRNARGYRLLEELILVDGKCLIVSVALERFLRHFTPAGDKPLRLWIRYVCVDQHNPNEMARYWTRQFQDKMYEMAESVVDMQRFLRDLLDRRVFERVIDSRYKEWTKKWQTLPETWPLPKVYPIRLGSYSSSERPTQAYQYVPLDTVADETRIIVIKPNEDKQAPLELHLAHCPLASDVGYFALSYTWGVSEDDVQVTVMGQSMHIRKNLERVLRGIRPSSSPHACAVWADAICINQSDTSEKNHQIPRIADVYDRAAGVICDVGEADHYSELALDFVEHLQEPIIRMDTHYEFIIGKPDRIDPDDIPRLCAALYLFLTRPYFRRVWVLQEVALASNPVISCGIGMRKGIAFEALETAAANLSDMMSRDPGLAQKMEESTPDLSSVDPAQLLFIRKLLYFRHLHIGGSRGGFIMHDIKDTAPGYLESAILARDFEAAVPHDKLFALWNVARDKTGLDFSADYSRAYEEAYMGFTKAWCAHSGSLDMIAASEFRQPVENHGFYSKASSWCPDWSTPALSSSLVRRERFRLHRISLHDDLDGPVYCADGGVRQQPDSNKYFKFVGNTLHCMGIILDKVDGIAASKTEHLPMRAVIPGLVEFCKDFFAKNNITTYDDVAQAMIAMVHGDCVASWPKKEGNSKLSPDEDLWTAPYACIPFKPRLNPDQDPNRSRHVPSYGGSYSSQEAWEVVRSIMRGRHLFVSEKGYMGLLPDYVGRVGGGGDDRDRDYIGHGGPLHLAILATCSVPVLLGEHPEIEGAYRFLGTCFVQGWMEGEVLKAEMGCDEPAEFWEAMAGTEKLRIV
ncbi:uncharacterized protein Z520_05629 [Fonsecaea multimorphosa CBS 102226]|uniref:Heterokaryon incompatibility domain-containing protein n=1 Tax=Fonsecaea multimorphosa CBS 102226 TaxID=1442371 RepID=A0A0D2KNQ1_9EURO|nr:uncharacterized protein Z520_05629 [Fonsecaea multimorphosa CBS 102226]KIX98328.1 hypothetical protein Z520_05629 [Fonsecaea multimorphosa CBS 102226]OAL24523.1 hypothetical protein AYO22_05312 [Fonsecaea multimorphosa]